MGYRCVLRHFQQQVIENICNDKETIRKIYYNMEGLGYGLFNVVWLEKAVAPHSSTLAWTIPWTQEPGRVPSMGSLSRTRLSDFTFTFHFNALEKATATHSSTLAWRIP